MPEVGSLWIWRGNHYEVIDVRYDEIQILEIGSRHSLFQRLVAGVWLEPTAMPAMRPLD